MQIKPKPLSTHRLTRFVTWLGLWLTWFLSVLRFLNDDEARAALEIKTRTFANLLFIAVGLRIPRNFRQRRHGGPPTRHELRNAQRLALKRIRRALRGRSVEDQALLMSRWLRTIDATATWLMLWMRRAPRVRHEPLFIEHALTAQLYASFEAHEVTLRPRYPDSS